MSGVRLGPTMFQAVGSRPGAPLQKPDVSALSCQCRPFTPGDGRGTMKCRLLVMHAASKIRSNCKNGAGVAKIGAIITIAFVKTGVGIHSA